MRLPDRTMRWAPVAVRHEAGIAAWQPSWVCMGCAQAEQLGDLSIPAEAGSPCDRCGSTLLWEYDRVTGVEAFGCPQRCARPARAPAPVRVAPPPQPPAQTLGSGNYCQARVADPQRVNLSCQHLPDHMGCLNRSSCAPSARRDPTHIVRRHMCICPGVHGTTGGLPNMACSHHQSPTNSWLYVPLLHGAIGMLSDRALALWRAEERPSPQWEEARRALAVSAPVPIAALTEALIAAASHRNEDLPQAALEEAAILPSSTLVHIGWGMRHIAHPDGYISAAGQEVCLMLYGGSALASALDRLSDAFRTALAPPAPAAPACRRLTLVYGDLSAADAP